ncbi:hypothetical protein DH2020_006484 [Rehmannia glutinosa]|uniref:Uncharacterized protein n=1 Tax=Rehmannia glutinosa TaxID=99300 RepID=A0ABR0XJ91_REHGL
MAEYQENSSKLHSISSLGKRDSIDSTVEADGGDEEFYEEIEAPKTPVKCPLSAPPKSSRPRLSRMAIISSISKKTVDEKKRVVGPLLKPGSTTPVTKTKPVAAKYLTTPRNKNCTQNQNSFRSVQNPKPTNIEVSKSRMVAKALVFRSPKKTIKVKTSAELRTPISKLCEGMNKLEISSQRKLPSGYSSKISEISSNSSKTCTNQEVKSGRCIKSKMKGKLSQQASKKLMGDDHADKLKNDESIDVKQQSDEKVAEEFEPQKSTHEEAPSVDSKTEGNCLDLKRCNNSSEGNENGSIENCGEPVDNLNANNTSEGERNGHEFMDGDDKENAAASDENRFETSEHVCERGILKEANLERRTTDHVAPPSESATLSTLGGKLQRKQGNDIQDNTGQINFDRLVSTKKETSSFLVPGQKLDVIHEASPEVSEVKRAGKTTGNAPLTDDAAACAATRSSSRGRRPITVATEPNFHSTHLTRTCTKKLK